MLTENEVADHLIQYLKVNRYSIKQALHSKQRGIDVIAEKQGESLFIEVKGATSGDETNSRYGKPFHSGQVFGMVSKVIFRALDKTNSPEFNDKNDLTCIALHKIQKFRNIMQKFLDICLNLVLLHFGLVKMEVLHRISNVEGELK